MAKSAREVQEDFSDMLKSENFSDVTVTCGDRTWKAHKFIVCRRSVWFSRALTGNFQEGQSGVVALQELDPVAVGWVIQYLYAANTQFLDPLLDDDETVHATCVELYKTADYFQLDDLTKASCDALKRNNKRAAAAFQKEYRQNPNHSLEPEFLERFFTHAKVAFSYGHVDLEDAFYHFFQCTRFMVLADITVHELLDDIPRFGQLLLRKMWSGPGEGVCLMNFIGDCSTCGRSAFARENGFVRSTEMYLDKGNGGKYSVAHTSTCDKCYVSDGGSEDEADDTSSDSSEDSPSDSSDD